MIYDEKESTSFENLKGSETNSATIEEPTNEYLSGQEKPDESKVSPLDETLSNSLDNQTIQPKERKAKVVKSLDDMELERANKLATTSPTKPERSKDDLSIIEQEKSDKLKSVKTNEIRISSEFLKYLEQEKKEIKTESKIKRAFSYIVNKAESAWNWIQNTKASKAVTWLLNTKLAKIALGSAVSRAITTTLAIVVLAGISPPTALAMAAVTLVGVAGGMVAETIKIRNLRKLAQENDLLMQNRGDISKQQYLLTLDPKLAQLLEKKLYVPTSVPGEENKHYHYVSSKAELALSTSKFFMDNIQEAASLASNIVAASSGNPVKIASAVKSGTASAISLISSGLTEKQSVDLATAFKININGELRKSDVANYQNLQELREIAQKQHIQTAALTELIRDKDYFKLTDEQKQNKFDIYQEALTEISHDKNYRKLTDEQRRDILHVAINKLEDKSNEKPSEKSNEQETETKEKKKSNNILVSAAKGTLSFLKDLGRAHDPFYEQPEVKGDSSLTKAMGSAKKSAEEIVTPAVIEQLRKSKSVPDLSQKESNLVHQKKLQRSNSLDRSLDR
ncbi:MAG: hypothetical protein LN568_03455 [Rickettsia endosymbiont of Pseudomimeciton antennatum]|nr:hypothetical protein [Rickettsia endosymbiont of Pseudomimeciton antennatum]MCC8397718.1 hypothetical protein [Rickettsia endosymbiont of Labidopullus appendiculatus]